MTHANKSSGLKAALDHLEMLDGARNLHEAVPIALFVGAGAFSMRSFFWMVDLFTWMGLGQVDEVLPSTIAFVLTFIVWMLTFLLASTVLQKMKFENIRSHALSRLVSLDLSRADKEALRVLVHGRAWTHDQILKDVVTRFANASFSD